MLLEESYWFSYVIKKYVVQNSVVLNIGSSTSEFIERYQPYIQENLLNLLHSKSCIIKNIDLKADEGVDLVGDIVDPNFVNQLKKYDSDVIICSNVLEHITDKKIFCDSLCKILSKKTIVLVSVPYKFPYHPDPIDTEYRPDFEQLKNAFPLLQCIEGKEVDCGWYFSYVNSQFSLVSKCVNLVKAIIVLLFSAITINKPKLNEVLWNFKKISATCGVFRLPTNE
ncbi:MAG: hypothetical protein WDA22_11080 [Bacteroidota bacterium]